MISPDVRSGGSGSGDVGATKALTGTNAIVCAAGGGPLLTKAVAVIEAAKESGMSLGLTTFSTAEGIGSNERDVQVARIVNHLRIIGSLLFQTYTAAVYRLIRVIHGCFYGHFR